VSSALVVRTLVLIVFQAQESGSFYPQAKIVRKTLIPTVSLLVFDFLSLKNYVNTPSKSNKQKKLFLKLVFVVLLMVNDENIGGSGSISQMHGYADPDPDPDPHQNVMDPQHFLSYREPVSRNDRITFCYLNIQ
jgi:hypothetical protein